MRKGPRFSRIGRSISFRWFLVVTALATFGAWWVTDQPRRVDRAIATTRRVGGVVRLDADKPRADVPKPGSSTWIKERLGTGFAHDLSVVNLDGRPVSDADLAGLEGVKGLRKLYLNGTPVTDHGIDKLRGLSGLEYIFVGNISSTTCCNPSPRRLRTSN